MKNSTKIILGILTFLPFVFLVIYIGFIFTSFIPTAIKADQTHDDIPVELFQSISVMLILIILMVIIKLGVIIYYIVHANNNPENDSGKKIMWTILLILVGTITSIVYYFVEILPAKENTTTLGYNS